MTLPEALARAWKLLERETPETKMVKRLLFGHLLAVIQTVYDGDELGQFEAFEKFRDAMEKIGAGV